VPDQTERIRMIETAPAPWRGASLYARIAAAIEARGEAQTDLLLDLDPEEEDADPAISWAPGAADSLFAAPDESPADVPARSIAAALSNAARRPSAETLQHLYTLLLGADAISIVDQVLPRVAEESAAFKPALAALARRILTDAPDVEPVKVAVALLGVFGEPDDVGCIETIGCHDEFTLFSAVALGNLLEDAEHAVWRLAQRVHGWGRIQAVERLKHTRDPAIKSWLLRRGVRNTIMDEYIAYLCATVGDLKGALSAARIDPDLLESASIIIDALIAGGPAEDIADYEDAPTALRLYLAHLSKTPARDLRHVLTAKRILDLVSGDERIIEWPAQEKWTLRTKSSAELSRPEWRERTQADLQSGNEGEFNQAARAFEALGQDAWPLRLEKQRAGFDQWWALAQTQDSTRMAELVALAEERLDLATIAAGPTMQIIAAGEGYADESALDYLLQELRRFTGLGWPLIAAGLSGRTIRVRNMAVRALNAWARTDWPPEALPLIREAEMREPDAEMRKTFAALRTGALDDY